ncbi:MAG: alpha-2-macroglobulin [Chromatiaceae bacterium]|nr:MAG: alpha-2-macroglobulin [Chromatiaceae bacterium]
MLRHGAWLVAGLVLLMAAGLASGGERRLVLIEDADLFGNDYDVLREVSLAECEAACLAAERCHAFTFNRNAGWCFLKAADGPTRPFDGATSGRIVTGPATGAEALARRRAELAFLPPTYRTEAAELRQRVAAEIGARSDGDAALLDLDRWQRQAEQALARQPQDWSARQQVQREASAAAINAYLAASTVAQRADGLALLGRALEQRAAWAPAIRTLRASLELVDDPGRRAHLDQLVAKHGFRVTGHSVAADASHPRICLEFSAALTRAGAGVELADFIEVDAPGLAIEPEPRQLCIDGVRHGGRYRIRVRAGLPAADGERLAHAVELDVFVRDRSPAVRFPGRAYVLPSGGAAALPIVTVNTSLVEAELFRIGERALGGFVGDETLFGSLGQWETEAIAERRGERLWRGQIEVQSALNQEVTTAVPVTELLTAAGQDRLAPGAYVLTAWPQEADPDGALATQWFVVSDLGLTALSGNDGLHALVRSLASAEPLNQVRLRLLALNQQVLGEARTDRQGYARFEPGLLRGAGGNAPALLAAETAAGDYGLLDLRTAPFDLSDRGVDGRPAPQPIDVYLVSERGIYRPGEQVVLTALARDPHARAVTGVPLTFIIRRPDGVEYLRDQVPDHGQGGRALSVPLLADAQRGTWQAQVYADPAGELLAAVPFLVEDFEPERLDFDLAASAAVLDPDDPPMLTLAARFLYGAPASRLTVEGETRIGPADGLPAWPGYRFGLVDDAVQPRSEPLPIARTDAQGAARLPIVLPDLVPGSRPLQAAIAVRVQEGSGRPVERTLTLPLADRRVRIGIRPRFDGAVEEGGNAAFDVIALGVDDAPIALDGLRWTLNQVQTSYQWYQTDGDWRFEPVTSRRRVASGALALAEPAGDQAEPSAHPSADLATDVAAGGRIEARVEWGSYELQVSAAGDAAVPASVAFEAGWYVAPKAFDTPDVLKVSLDKAEYRVGETARVRLEPRFPGLALLMVLDDGLKVMRPVRVPAEGTTVALPVTADWGPGAYVTAVLYRGLDLAARQLPRRAIGLHWAGVDPGDRRLDLRLQVPAQAAPRGPLPVTLQIANLPRGGEAHLAIAAVDIGILNLTRFETWAPAGWYFGQRRLGIALRDLYGRLIDRMQGTPGRLRSGAGVLALMRAEGPPPSEALVAFHSGILRADANGQAEVAFPLPDFNGSVRVMVMAWSADGIGQAAADVLVRDPVVVTASLPRFLAPGDRSRLLLELAHVEGPAGAMTLTLSSAPLAAGDGDDAAGTGLIIEGVDTPLPVTLPAGERTRISVPIAARASGDHRLRVALTLPDGQVLTKDLLLGVRNLTAPVWQTSQRTLAPGGAPLVLDAGWLGAADAPGGFVSSGFVPNTGAWLVSITGAGALDVAGLLRALDRFPYGCVEQITSRALPLLYLDPLALAVGLAPDGPTTVPDQRDAAAGDLRSRIEAAIRRVLANQTPSGSFGLWGPSWQDSTDLWLDAYVTDFLTRARERGHAVPAVALDLALTSLRNQLAYAGDFGIGNQRGGEGVAYALYVLARNGRVPIGDLRYYQEMRLTAFATPMARAQLGAALALVGEAERAAIALRSAHDLWQAQPRTGGWRVDFGSWLRDGAALLTLAAEASGSGPPALDLDAIATELGRAATRVEHSSTQDQAWLLLAAHALMQGAARPRLSIDGVPYEGAFYRRLDEVDLAAGGLQIENVGDRPVTALVTAAGIPLIPPPAGGQGYRIDRAYYGLDGRAIDPARLTQGTRLVTLLTISADAPGAARLIIDDPLPAGLEIDNPSLLTAGSIDGLPWLEVVTTPAYREFRAERFVAAVERGTDDPARFQLAYLVRAVTPGHYQHPAAAVADLYRAEQRARTAAGEIEVLPAVGEE